jgi:hypothetical protein
MTTPNFIPTDETAFDDDRALTAEHGRRIVRNALAIWNERAGAVGSAQRLVGSDGTAASSRVIITANWAYVGPLHYYCPAPCGESNIARPIPTVRLLLTGRATGLASSYVYAVNQSVATPSEDQMDTDVASGPGGAWFEIDTATWSASLEVPVTPGWNTIWLGFLCGLYGEPESLDRVVDEDTFKPWLAEYVLVSATRGSHPAIISPRSGTIDTPNFAVLVATTLLDFVAGTFARYTVPFVQLTAGVDNVPSYMYTLWEPFRAELSSIAPILQSDIEPWVNPSANARPVEAFRQPLDVINLDSIAVDGSQVWQLEDATFGAGLRWWQLPSAMQFRQAANMAQKARMAVAPQVAIANNIAGSQVYPLPTTGGKPALWNSDKDALLNFAATSVPNAHPIDTVTLEVCVSVCVSLVNRRRSAYQALVRLRLRIFEFVLGTYVATETSSMVVSLIPIGAGSLDGSSVLARTIGWSSVLQAAGLTQYGQEGLTRRNDWRAWTTLRGVISVPRATVSSATGQFMIRVFTSIDDPTPADFEITTADIGVRIVGS